MVTPSGLVRPEPKPAKPKLTPEQIEALKAKKAAEKKAKAEAVKKDNIGDTQEIKISE